MDTFRNNIETSAEIEGGDDDVEVTHPFDPRHIEILTSTDTIYNIVDAIKHNDIKLDPDFQRKEVWDNTRKSRLIESILLGIPLPMFYMAMTKDGILEVVDGIQRLSTLRDFITPQENSSFIQLINLEFLTDLNTKTFDKLPRNHQRTIYRTNIQITTIRPGTPEEVKFNIFKRINTGGMPLSPQEIRNATHQGAATVFLTKLSNLESFKKVITVSRERMQDKELVLRLISYLLMGFNKITNHEKFLADGMIIINDIGGTPEKLSSSYVMPKYEHTTLDNLENLFDTSMTRAYELLREYAFRRSAPYDERKTPINRPLFDSLGYWLAKISKNNWDKLMSNNSDFYKKYFEYIKSDKFDQINKHWSGQEITGLFDKIREFMYGE